MTDLRTAAQQALTEMANARDYIWLLDEGGTGVSEEEILNKITNVITALRAALAEPNRAQKMRDAGYTRRPTLRELAEGAEPVAGNWSVFSSAEVFSGMSLADAVAELNPARLERGWSAVCVLNKDNPPTHAPPQRKPLTEEEIQELSQQHKFDSRMEKFVRIVEAAHGIK